MSTGTKRYTLEEKLTVVFSILDGERSKYQVSKEDQINYYTVESWLRKYEDLGIDGLKQKTNQYYTETFKEGAVRDHLKHGMSIRAVCRKYSIYQQSVLRGWIKQYTSGKKKFTRKKRSATMTRNRQPAFEEKLEIVQYVEKNAATYKETAQTFNVSYQQVYTWVGKYRDQGAEGLKDRRGRSLASKDQLTETERLRLELQAVKKRNAHLEMENDVIKKLKEIEGRGPHKKGNA